jgi:hypothetical protein
MRSPLGARPTNKRCVIGTSGADDHEANAAAVP